MSSIFCMALNPLARVSLSGLLARESSLPTVCLHRTCLFTERDNYSALKYRAGCERISDRCFILCGEECSICLERVHNLWAHTSQHTSPEPAHKPAHSMCWMCAGLCKLNVLNSRIRWRSRLGLPRAPNWTRILHLHVAPSSRSSVSFTPLRGYYPCVCVRAMVVALRCVNGSQG